MILLTRTVPYLSAMTLLLFMLSMGRWPSAVGVTILLTLSVAAVVLATGRIAGWGRDLAGWWHVALTPGIFALSLPGMTLFVEQTWMYVLIIVLSSLFVFLFLEHLLRFVHLSGIYQPYALEHTSLVLHTATMYFVSVGGFGLLTFLRVNRWMLIIAFLLISLVLIYEMMWVSKIRDTNALRIAAVGALLITELFAVLTWLPMSFYVSAAVLALAFYMYIGIQRAEQLQKLSGVVLKRYMFFGIGLLILLLLTAQWT